MDDGSGSKTYFADAAGKPVPRPGINSQVASPINLLNPDRYEFYTFDDTGDLVKRLMTLDEIQGIIAGGDGDAALYSDDQTLADTADMLSIPQSPELRVKDVVANIQSVMKGEMEQQKKQTTLTKPMLDTPDVSATWSMILPAIFGNTGGDIIPEKHPQVIMTPETEVVDTVTLKSNSTNEQPAESREPITDKTQQNESAESYTISATTKEEPFSKPVSAESDLKEDTKNYTLISYTGTTEKYSSSTYEPIIYEKVNIENANKQETLSTILDDNNVAFITIKPLDTATTLKPLNQLSEKHQSSSNAPTVTDKQKEDTLDDKLFYTIEYTKPSSESSIEIKTSETNRDPAIQENDKEVASSLRPQEVIFDNNSKPALYSVDIIKPLHKNISSEVDHVKDIPISTVPSVLNIISGSTAVNNIVEPEILDKSPDSNIQNNISQPKPDGLAEESKIAPTVIDSISLKLTTNEYDSQTKAAPTMYTSTSPTDNTFSDMAQNTESDEIIKTEATQSHKLGTTFTTDSRTESLYTKQPYHNFEELYSTSQQLYTIPAIFDILKINTTKDDGDKIQTTFGESSTENIQNPKIASTENIDQTQEDDSNTSKFTTVTSYQDINESTPKEEFIIHAGSLENDYTEEQQGSTFSYYDYYKTTNNDDVTSAKETSNGQSSTYTTNKIPTTQYDEVLQTKTDSDQLYLTQTSSTLTEKSTESPITKEINKVTEFANPSTIAVLDESDDSKLSTAYEQVTDSASTNLYTEQQTTDKVKDYDQIKETPTTTINTKISSVTENTEIAKEDEQIKSEVFTTPSNQDTPVTQYVDDVSTLKPYSLSDIMGSMFTNVNDESLSTRPESDSLILSLQESLSNVISQVSDDSSDTSVPLILHSEITTQKAPSKIQENNDDQITYETSVVKETSSVSMEAGRPHTKPQYNEYHSSESSSTEDSYPYDSQSSEENYPVSHKAPNYTPTRIIDTTTYSHTSTSQKPIKNKLNDEVYDDLQNKQQTHKPLLTSSEEYPANPDQYQGFGTRIGTTTQKYFTTQPSKLNRHDTTKYIETSTSKADNFVDHSSVSQDSDSSIIIIKATTERVKNNKGENKKPSTIYANTYNTNYKLSSIIPIESSTYHLKLNSSTQINSNKIHQNAQKIKTELNATNPIESQFNKVTNESYPQDNIQNESKNEDVSTISDIKINIESKLSSTTEGVKNSDTTSMKSNPRITTEYEKNNPELFLTEANATFISDFNNIKNNNEDNTHEHVIKPNNKNADEEKTTVETEEIGTTKFIINAGEIDYTTENNQAVYGSATIDKEYSTTNSEQTSLGYINDKTVELSTTTKTIVSDEINTEQGLNEQSTLYDTYSPDSSSTVDDAQQISTIDHKTHDPIETEKSTETVIKSQSTSAYLSENTSDKIIASTIADEYATNEQNVNEYSTTQKELLVSQPENIQSTTTVNTDNQITTEIKNIVQEAQNTPYTTFESTVQPEFQQTIKVQENSNDANPTTITDNIEIISSKPASVDLQADTSDILITESEKNKTDSQTFANDQTLSLTTVKTNDDSSYAEDEKWKIVTTINALQSETTKVPAQTTSISTPTKIENIQFVYQTTDSPISPQIVNEDTGAEPIRFSSSPKENLGLLESTAGLSEDISEFADLCNELAFKYWQAVTNKGISTSRGLVISPFAVTSLLAMMFMGARGATSEEMNEILKLDDMVTFNPHLVFKNVTESIEVNKRSGVATSAFVRELFSDRTKVKLLGFYKQRAQQFYGGHVEEVNYNVINDIVRRRTNLLVKRQTWDKIPEYLKSNVITLRPPLAALSANIFQVMYLKLTRII